MSRVYAIPGLPRIAAIGGAVIGIAIAIVDRRPFVPPTEPGPLTLDGTPPEAELGNPYSFVPSRGGGTSPYSYAIISGSLPAGLTLNSGTGEISGTPT